MENGNSTSTMRIHGSQTQSQYVCIYVCTYNLYIHIYFAGRNVDFGYAPSKIYNYTFYAGDSEASPDANVSIVDDLHFEEKENFVISIIDVSLPYGYEMNENATATICIIDNDSKYLILLQIKIQFY